MIDKVRVLFLGSRPLGKKALELLMSYDNVEIVGVVTKEKSSTAWWDEDPIDIASNIPKISMDELNNIEFDLGVSINYWRIIENEVISRPRLGFINLHHSHNLYYRGRDMTSHAILNARNENLWFHGTCLHYTDDGLDTGPVIASKSCEISRLDTSWTLFNKVEELGGDLITEWLPRVLLRKLPCCKPSDKNPLNYRKELSRELDPLSLKGEELFDFVRAFDFNNLFEPAYYVSSDGKKVYLTTDKRYASDVYSSICDERVVYFNNYRGLSN